jgi:hypothetical protein
MGESHGFCDCDAGEDDDVTGTADALDGTIAERAVRMRSASSSRARSVAGSLRPSNTAVGWGLPPLPARSAASSAWNVWYMT